MLHFDCLFSFTLCRSSSGGFVKQQPRSRHSSAKMIITRSVLTVHEHKLHSLPLSNVGWYCLPQWERSIEKADFIAITNTFPHAQIYHITGKLTMHGPDWKWVGCERNEHECTCRVKFAIALIWITRFKTNGMPIWNKKPTMECSE